MPSNESPLAQQAKRALETLKVKPEPDRPYPLQLVRTCLERRKMCPMSDQERADLLDALDHLDGMPERALDLLERGPESEPGEAYLMPDPDLTPEELALDLIVKLKISLNALDALPKRSAL
ncbi:MAG: hypothetical protein JNJ76_00075 [Candidatus Competibacter sp.]|nr:hypothetical protein [Candidatus Competibacter sp.]